MTQIIPYADPTLVRQVLVPAWVTPAGVGYHNEDQARYAACTHKPCSVCGDLVRKQYSLCEICLAEKTRLQYLAYPKKTWDRITPVYSRCIDDFFMDEESILDWCEENQMVFGDPFLSDFEFVWCKPQRVYELDPYDLYSDIIPEDGELPSEIEEAFKTLNQKIKECQEIVCWEPTNIAVCLHTTALADWFRKTYGK